MSRCKTAILRWIFCLVSLAWIASPVYAHALKFGSVSLQETDTGVWQVNFRYSGSETSLATATLALSENCVAISTQRESHWLSGRGMEGTLRCTAPVAPQWLEVKGVDDAEVQIIFNLTPLQGATKQWLRSGRSLRVETSVDATHSATGAALALNEYLPLGIYHILMGPDHLAFVLLMLFFATQRSTLLAVISAFTIGHTITLMLTSLGYITLASRQAEVMIALSLVLLAAELARIWQQPARPPTFTQRYPAVAALIFGGVHGLGFAAVLAEVGLPQQHQVPALLCFNVGVEVGQLLFIGACLGGISLCRRMRIALPRQITVYGIGLMGAFFMWERLL